MSDKNMKILKNVLLSNAADYFGFRIRGYIKQGYDSDFSLVNLWDNQLINSREMHSKGKYTPF